MDSIQLVRLLDVAPINLVREADGVSPRSLIIRGRDFRSVEQVVIDGVPSPEFVVYSETELIAQVPDLLQESTIFEVTVLSQNLTLTERSMVEFTFGTRPKMARGVVRMMQNFLRILLRSPGSNVFHPRAGGGMLARIGKTVSQRSAADVQIAVSLTKQYIIGAQTAARTIPANERLLEAEVTAISPDPASASLYVTLVLTNQAGQRAGSTLVT
jgi:hypothetical protein